MADDARLEFLKKDYELKISYLTSHFGRMWTRFSFFVTLETALIAAYFGAFKDSTGVAATSGPIAVLATVLSVFWYVFGAQDRYLVRVYIEHIRLAAEVIADKLNLPEYLGGEYIHVANANKPKVKMHFYQWRLEFFSVTVLAAVFPLVLLALWLTVLSLKATRYLGLHQYRGSFF